MISAKKLRKTTERERLEISSRKLEIPREHFMQDGHNKGQRQYGPNRSRRSKEEVARLHTKKLCKNILMSQITMIV